MAEVPVSIRDEAVDVLTTHRHGENRDACKFCTSFYNDLLVALEKAGYYVVKEIE